MFYEDRSINGTHPFIHSPRFKHALSGLAPQALARLAVDGGALHLATVGGASACPRSLASQAAAGAAETVIAVTRLPGTAPCPGWLPDPVCAADGWSRYRIELGSGRVDELALRLPDPAQAEGCADALSAFWAALRADLLDELGGHQRIVATEALMWMISKRVGAAVLVLDAAGQLLQVNAAAAAVLKSGLVLREAPDGLRCRSAAETRALRLALQNCIGRPDESEYILFLDGNDGGPRLPLSLSRYQAGPEETLIVAVLAARPDPKRIEMLAQKMGLTPAEARVASLMQLGLSNREAAYIAGLKEQTFSTYSKRVLAKLNVGCRAEMAQMLTWQAGLGGAS